MPRYHSRRPPEFYGKKIGVCQNCGANVGDENPELRCLKCDETLLPNQISQIEPLEEINLHTSENNVPKSDLDAASQNSVKLNTEHPATQEAPLLSKVLFFLSIVSIISGINMSYNLWPGDPDPGYSLKFVAYVPALIWLSAGIVNTIFFWFMGSVRLYLKKISEK